MIDPNGTKMCNKKVKINDYKQTDSKTTKLQRQYGNTIVIVAKYCTFEELRKFFGFWELTTGSGKERNGHFLSHFLGLAADKRTDIH